MLIESLVQVTLVGYFVRSVDSGDFDHLANVIVVRVHPQLLHGIPVRNCGGVQ